MSWLRSLRCAVMVAGLTSIAVFPQSASARVKAPSDALVYRAFDGKPITHKCSPNLNGLKRAMVTHARSLVGFKWKMRSGAYFVPKKARIALERQSASEILNRIRAKLNAIDGARRRPSRSPSTSSKDTRTAALIYDVGAVDGQYSLCAWFVTSHGLEAAATVPLPPLPLAELVRSSMGVTALAEARMPVRRRKARRTPKAKRSVRQQPVKTKRGVGDNSQAGPLVVTLADAADLVLPAPIRERLIRSGSDGPTQTGFNRLLILPAADIGTLPFAALPVGDKHLIDHVAIVLLPDIDALLAKDFANPPQSGTLGSALVVGDPDLSRDRNWLFKPLPAAKSEAIRVGILTGAAPLIGGAATRKGILKALKKRPRLIYFATHGIADAVNPMDGSFLALKGGHLFGRDIKRLRSNLAREFVNPIVVMSACQTGLGKVFGGGVFGLARAWHYAGAWQVVMSLWNVDDEATQALMTRFMTSATSGARYRRARRVFRDTRTDRNIHRQRDPGLGSGIEFDLRTASIHTRRDYQNPALWAGFVHYGLPTMQQR